MTFPIEKVRADFPVLTREVNGLPLAYLKAGKYRSGGQVLSRWFPSCAKCGRAYLPA